jgi:two-component system, OmpR family, response regulator
MQRKRILVLDDDVSMTRLLKLHLDNTGRYEVRVENHGSRALSAALEFRPDLILLDLVMPDLGGEEILGAIDAEEALRGVTVLLLTASAPDQAGGHRVAALPRVTKPVRAAALIESIEGHLA